MTWSAFDKTLSRCVTKKAFYFDIVEAFITLTPLFKRVVISSTNCSKYSSALAGFPGPEKIATGKSLHPYNSS